MTGAREHCGKSKMRSLIPKEVTASPQDLEPVSDPTGSGDQGQGLWSKCVHVGHKHQELGGVVGRGFKTNSG